MQRTVRMAAVALNATAAEIRNEEDVLLASYGELPTGYKRWALYVSEVRVRGRRVAMLRIFDRSYRVWSQAEQDLLDDFAALVSEDLEADDSETAKDAYRSLETRRLGILVNSLHEAVLLVDASRSIRYVNDAFCQMMGIKTPAAALIGKNYTGAAEEAMEDYVDSEKYLHAVERILVERRPALRHILRRVDDRWLERDYRPIFHHGQYEGHLWVYRDVTARECARLELEFLGERDELTGILNRRGFCRMAEVRARDAARYGRHLTIVAADLDQLRGINRRLGREAGDQALIEFAELATEVARGSDLVARIGGDEFAMLLFGCDEQSASVFIERLQERLARTHYAKGRIFGISASLGCATTVPQGQPVLDDLLEAADQEMHAQKGQRRPVSV